MSDDKKKWSEIVLEERKKGNVVCILLPGEVGTIPVKEIVKQPVDGLLWDLNRDEATALTFMDQEGMQHWVNNFAVALVIRELHSENAALKEKIETSMTRHNKTLRANAEVAGINADLVIEIAALEQELRIGRAFILDYLQAGGTLTIEPFYTWGKRVDALLKETN